MATKKDLDDILNNNAKVKKSSAKKSNTKKRAKNGMDNMSVDDVLNSLDSKKSDTPKKLAPLPPKKSAAKPAPTENKTKKRIVISGELPDYDALRNQELEKEKQKKAKEEAEKKRLEAEKKAKEEAEKKRLEAEKKAKEEAERKRIEAEKKAKEEAEKKRLEAEKKAKEEAERKRIEAEKKAKEEAEKKRLEAEKKAKEEAERKRIEAEKRAKEEAEKKRLEAEKKAKEEAEKKRLEEETKRRMLEEAEEFTVEEITEISTSEKYDDDDYEEIEIFEETNDSDPVGSLIDNIREDAEKAFADIENSGNNEEDEKLTEENPPDEEDDEEDNEEKPSGITATLENILDEDPDEIINARREKTETDKKKKPKLRLKKNIYTFFGLVFAVLACVGLVTIVSKGISLIGGLSSGNSKKTGFEPVVYPAVIMDIESFETPAELPSEQIITAAIWSMIMSDDAISNYEQTFDVVKIPAVDVELYAVKMFGENLPALNHTTVGPAESRFYYNEETKSYNVPIAPVTYTYSPEIKGATKNDNTYTIVVDYIDELPEWLPKKSSKSVEFKLTETNDGYIINSMKVLSTSSNAL